MNALPKVVSKILEHKTILSYAVLYAGSAALLKLVGFISFLYLAKVLSTVEYAEFGLMYSLQTAIITFSMAGVIEYTIAHMHRKRNSFNDVFKVANTIFLILVALVVLIIFIFYSLNFTYTINTSNALLAAVVINSVLLVYALFKSQIERLTENHKKSLIYGFVIPFVGMLCGLSCFYFFKNLFSFFAGSSFGLLISILPSLKRISFGTRFDILILKVALIGCLPFIGMAFFNWLSGYGNNQLLDIFFEEEAIAVFTFLFSISALMQLVATALNQVWSPRFYKITHIDPFNFVESKNQKFFKFMTLCLSVVGALLIYSLPFISGLIGGNTNVYSENQHFLIFLVAGYVVLGPWWHCQNYFLAYNKGGELFNLTIISSLIGVCISLILMSTLGEIGVYIGFFIVMLIRALLIVRKSKKYWNLRVSWGSVFGGLFIVLLSFILLSL